MSIVDGSAILAADLNTAYDAALALAQAANAEAPSAAYFQLQYRDINSGTDPLLSQSSFVMPDDMFIDEVSVQTGDMAGTVTVMISSTLIIEPIVITGTVTSPGVSKLPRYFSDPTKPQQILLRNSLVTVTAATTDAPGTQTICVGIGLVGYRRRY